MKRTAHAAVLAPVSAPPSVPADPVEALRRRLAGSTAREHVLLDFLQDDLREAKDALAEVGAFVASIEGALADREASPDRLLSLALGGGPVERIEYLGEVLAHVRRRLAQVAARM